jgi:hypothetical protein
VGEVSVAAVENTCQAGGRIEARGSTNLGTEAVSDSAELLDALLALEELDGLNDDGVDVLGGVGVVAGGALGEPAHEVEVVRAVEGQGVTVEGVDDQGQVAVGGELVGHQLAVLPDGDDVRDVEDGSILVRLGRVGSRDVGIVLANLDILASGFAPVGGRFWLATWSRGRHGEVDHNEGLDRK